MSFEASFSKFISDDSTPSIRVGTKQFTRVTKRKARKPRARKVGRPRKGTNKRKPKKRSRKPKKTGDLY